MTSPQRSIARFVILRKKMLHRVRVVCAPIPVACQLKQILKLILVGISNLDPIGNTTKECLVDKFRRIEVCREDDQLLEWDLNLLAVRERQEVVSVLQRNDPSIQQIGRRYSLATKVVDQQTPAVAFHLQWCLADIRNGIVPDLQSIHCQLTADDNCGPANSNPSLIVFPCGFG